MPLGDASAVSLRGNGGLEITGLHWIHTHQIIYPECTLCVCVGGDLGFYESPELAVCRQCVSAHMCISECVFESVAALTVCHIFIKSCERLDVCGIMGTTVHFKASVLCVFVCA